MRTLVISDVITPLLYSPQIKDRFPSVNLIISCGDLPFYYLEYIISLLCTPLFFVRGNHDPEIEHGEGMSWTSPGGGQDLHRKVVRYKGLLLAGVEGCLRYREGPFQYTQSEMWLNVSALIPHLLWNRLRYGRYLDIFVTHAPPRGIHEMDDLPHQGVDAFRWFIQKFQPRYHLHGHIHVLKPNIITQTQIMTTMVINAYGFCEITPDIPGREQKK